MIYNTYRIINTHFKRDERLFELKKNNLSGFVKLGFHKLSKFLSLFCSIRVN